MKRSHTLRSLLALTLIAGLAACGGKNGTFDLGGIIVGTLNFDGLVLANGATTLAVPRGATGYLFPGKLSIATVFNVTVQTNPPNTRCVVASGGSGSAGTTSTSSGVIRCELNTVLVGGVIRGLRLPGLELRNGADFAFPTPATTVGADVNFQMPTQVPFGSNYGLTIARQPQQVDAAGNVTARQICSFRLDSSNVSTGVGTVNATTSPYNPANGGSNANISTVMIDCV